jgi:hypothetical protein
MRSTLPMSQEGNGRSDCVVQRPIFLQSSLSSLQVAVSNSRESLRRSSLRYNGPHYSNSASQSFENVTGRGLKLTKENSVMHDWQSHVSVSQSQSMYHQAEAKSSPSAFMSSLQVAVAAGRETNSANIYTPADHLSPISTSHGAIVAERSQRNPQGNTTTTPHSEKFASALSTVTEQDRYGNGNLTNEVYLDDEDDESGLFWNPPVREAVVFASSLSAVYSPLTVHSNRATPTLQDTPNTWHQPANHSTPSTSQNEWVCGSPYAFVPIREADGEVEEQLSSDQKHWSSSNTTSPTTLSWSSKSWEPVYPKSESNKDYRDDEKDEYFSSSSDRYETPASHFQPTMESSSFCYKKGYNHSNSNGFMAPSPSFTVETAEMTLDPPSIVESKGINASKHKASSLLLAVGSPPLYSPTPQPLHRTASSNSSNILKNVSSSLAIAAAAERQQYHHDVALNTPCYSQLVPLTYSKSISSLVLAVYPQEFCYPFQQEQLIGQPQTFPLRPQSAPTLGRPTLPITNSVTSSKTSNEEELQQRKCRLKTELCMHFENGRPCPFGASYVQYL